VQVQVQVQVQVRAPLYQRSRCTVSLLRCVTALYYAVLRCTALQCHHTALHCIALAVSSGMSVQCTVHASTYSRGAVVQCTAGSGAVV
jgi:hypothetical protein